MITRRQLHGLGFTDEAIDHRIRTGRLHPAYRGVYAVGRPELTRYGRWMAATLACGTSGALSHGSAAALWGIGSERGGVEISVPHGTFRRQPGIRLHRRAHLETTTHHRIPVTTPTATIIDLASYLPRNETEHAINEATDRKLTDPDLLRAAVHDAPPAPGVAKLRKTLDILTFVLTRSELERLFLPIATRAGLPKAQTRPATTARPPSSRATDSATRSTPRPA